MFYALHQLVRLLKTITKIKTKVKHQTNLRFPLHKEGLPVGENMRRIISISQSIDNSLAFFMMPCFLLAYVAWRPFVFSNFFIFSFTLPILHLTPTFQSSHFSFAVLNHSRPIEKIKIKKSHKTSSYQIPKLPNNSARFLEHISIYGCSCPDWTTFPQVDRDKIKQENKSQFTIFLILNIKKKKRVNRDHLFC